MKPADIFEASRLLTLKNQTEDYLRHLGNGATFTSIVYCNGVDDAKKNSSFQIKTDSNEFPEMKDMLIKFYERQLASVVATLQELGVDLNEKTTKE